MSVRDPDAPRKQNKDRSHQAVRRHRHKVEQEKLDKREAARKAPVERAQYARMTRVVLDAMPDHAPGVTAGQVYEAARANTSHRMFPGDLHRMVARQVLDDLRASGAVHEDDERHLWRNAHVPLGDH